jgi:hypothetical protein
MRRFLISLILAASGILVTAISVAADGGCHCT